MLKSIKPKAPSINIINTDPVIKAQEGTKTKEPQTAKEEVFDPEMLFVDKYNTPLTNIEKVAFNDWVQAENKRQGRDIMWDKGTYDIQGFWKNDRQIDENNHASDKWKKPNHPSFSDQSIYHGVDGYVGGTWEGKGFRAAPQTLKWYGIEALVDRFESEPGIGEYLIMPEMMKPTQKLQKGAKTLAEPVDNYVDPSVVSYNRAPKTTAPVQRYRIGGNIGDDPTIPAVKYDTTEADKTHQAGKDFAFNWFANPITRKKYRANMNEYYGTNEQNLGTDNNIFKNALVGVQEARAKFMGPSKKGTATAEYSPARGIAYYGKPSKGTALHEHIHATRGIDKDMTNFAMKKWGLLRALRNKHPGSTTREAVKKQFGLSSDWRVNEYIKNAEYMSTDGELYPRIMEMRQFLNVVPGQEVTDDMIKRIYADPKVKKAAEYYKPQILKEMLNTMASNNATEVKRPYKYLNSEQYGYAQAGIKTYKKKARDDTNILYSILE